MISEQPNIKLVRAVPYQDGTGWNYPVNYYPYNTLYFVLGGDGFVRVNDRLTVLKPGHVYLIPANTLFSCWCDTHIDKLYADVYAEIVPGFDIFSQNKTVLELPYSSGDIRLLCQASQRGGLRDSLLLKGEITRVLALFLDEDFCLPDTGILRYRPLLNDIEQHLTAQLKVKEIAEKYSWNPTVLSRNFRKIFHCSLKEYLERLLLSRIKQELIVTDKSIKELASEYGFCDQYYLSGFFKKHEGCSPSVYRRNNGSQLKRGKGNEN